MQANEEKKEKGIENKKGKKGGKEREKTTLARYKHISRGGMISLRQNCFTNAIHFSHSDVRLLFHTVISLPIRGETLAIGAVSGSGLVFGPRRREPGNVRKGVADALPPLGTLGFHSRHDNQ